MSGAGFIWAGVLAIAVIGSALATVSVRYEIRKHYAGLQELLAHKDQLEIEWRRLLIEEATWGTASRVERLAHERLGMHLPSADAIVVVNRGAPSGG